MRLEIEHDTSAKIKVFGAGGAGGNAVNNMIMSSLGGVEFITANTDIQAINKSLAPRKLQLGEKLTKGLGAGADPNVGRDAALESIEEIKLCIGDADMVFVTAGMGGGTGTGAAPVIAQAAKEVGALTVAVVSKPFYFEGQKRLKSAERGIEELKAVVDSIITIPNDRLLQLAAKKATFLEMLKKADEVLYYAVKGIADLITVHGLINLDFADVQAVMANGGLALMGTGIARGEGRAREAAMKAITSPLLEDVSIEGARGLLINITCSPDMTIEEVSEAANLISQEADENAQVFFGTVFDPDVADEMRITVIATGIDKETKQCQPEDTSKVRLMPVRSMPGRAPIGGNQVRKSTINIMEKDMNIPAYLRKTKEGPDAVKAMAEAQAVAARTKVTAKVAPGPGEEEFIFDEDELEIPSFIRKQAD